MAKMRRVGHSPIGWISDTEWDGFLVWLWARGLSQAQACGILTEHANLTGGRGVVIKALGDWLSVGGEGRTLADARRIIRRGTWGLRTAVK